MTDLKQAVLRLRDRLFSMVARGTLSRVDDGRRMQEVQVKLSKRELRDGVEHPQSYGFTSHPFAGAETVVVFPRGDRSHGLAVVVDDRRYRLKNLAEGEVALYDDLGQVVHLKRDGVVISTGLDITASAGGDVDITAGGKASVTAPEIEATATTKASVTAPEVEVAATTKVTLDTPIVEATALLRTVGDITVFHGTANEIGIGAFIAAYNAHTHKENDAPNDTDQPTQQI